MNHLPTCPKYLNDAALCDCREQLHAPVSETKCRCGEEFKLRVELLEHIDRAEAVEELVH